jgi:hypothetical protein
MPIYKADWTDYVSVENALDYFLNMQERRRSGQRLVPFSVERLDYRESDREAFYRRLAENGERAVQEFKEAFG